MRTPLVALLALALTASPALGHRYAEHGTVLVPGTDPFRTGIYGLLLEAVLEDTGLHEEAGDLVPNGLLFWDIHGVQGGDVFSLVADDGQVPFVVGTADECPGPEPRLADPQWWIQESAVLCNYLPDFDVFFSGGSHGNGPGNEAGVVPGDGEALVVLFFGDLGEGFTYTEA